MSGEYYQRLTAEQIASLSLSSTGLAFQTISGLFDIYRYICEKSNAESENYHRCQHALGEVECIRDILEQERDRLLETSGRSDNLYIEIDTLASQDLQNFLVDTLRDIEELKNQLQPEQIHTSTAVTNNIELTEVACATQQASTGIDGSPDEDIERQSEATHPEASNSRWFSGIKRILSFPLASGGSKNSIERHVLGRAEEIQQRMKNRLKLQDYKTTTQYRYDLKRSIFALERIIRESTSSSKEEWEKFMAEYKASSKELEKGIEIRLQQYSKEGPHVSEKEKSLVSAMEAMNRKYGRALEENIKEFVFDNETDEVSSVRVSAILNLTRGRQCVQKQGFVEWRYYEEGTESGLNVSTVGAQVGILSHRLSSEAPEQALIPTCVNYFHDRKNSRYGMFFSVPHSGIHIEGKDVPIPTRPISLLEMLSKGNTLRPEKGVRLKLAAYICRAVTVLHHCSVVHKAIHCSNIIFFPDVTRGGPEGIDFHSPYLCGLQYARDVYSGSELADRTGYELINLPLEYIQSRKAGKLEDRTKFPRHYDLFGLSQVLLEIGEWQSHRVYWDKWSCRTAVNFHEEYDKRVNRMIDDLELSVGKEYCELIKWCRSSARMVNTPYEDISTEFGTRLLKLGMKV